MSLKLKYYTRVNPFTKQKEYQTLMIRNVDGKNVTYRTSFHNSRQKARDEIARAQGEIRATIRDEPITVRQNYGTTRAELKPRSFVRDVLKTGGMITPSKEYDEIKTNPAGIQKTTKNQRGIRKSRTRSLLHANMLNLSDSRVI